MSRPPKRIRSPPIPTAIPLITSWSSINGRSAGATREFARDQIVDVTVRGDPGLRLPAPGPDTKKAIVWDEGGITYSLITNSLPLDERLKVADSLGH